MTNQPLLRQRLQPSNARVQRQQQPVAIVQQPATPLLQPRLTIGPVDDPYEREAERVADQVMRMPVPGIQRAPAQIQRCAKCASKPVEEMCPSCKAKALTQQGQIQRAADGVATEMSPEVEGQIQVLRGGGQPLDGEVRRFMEPRFGYDFGGVRVHTGPQAARAASSVNALAFTLGDDVVFGAGQYQPGSEAGKKLIAHELTHVVQQGNNHNALLKSMDVRNSKLTQSVQRYSHQDCSENDLRDYIWPGDYMAWKILYKAVRVMRELSLNGISSKIYPKVSHLLLMYFRTSSPQFGKIYRTYKMIKREMAYSNYQYECEDECSDSRAYVYRFWTDIHICMNQIRGDSKEIVARTIIHELSHYVSGTDDYAYCKQNNSCPETLSIDDALENADSYACFAYDLFYINV